MPPAPGRHSLPQRRTADRPPNKPRAKEDRGSSFGRGYTKKWQRFRDQHLREYPLCEYCLADGRTTAASVVDHDLPHEHDPSLFWANTYTSLCAAHHNGEKQRAEAMLSGDDLLAWVRRRKRPRKRWGFSIPHGLQPSAVPVTIISGAPASGKSTYARQHAKPGDLIIDFDIIRRAVGGTKWDDRPEIIRAAFTRRAEMLHSLSSRSEGQCWLIVMAPTQRERDTWREALGHKAQVIVLGTPEATCIERITRDPERKPVAAKQVEAVRTWWAAS